MHFYCLIGPKLVACLPGFGTTTPIVRVETCILSLHISGVDGKVRTAQKSERDETKKTPARVKKQQKQTGFLPYRHLEYRAKTCIQMNWIISLSPRRKAATHAGFLYPLHSLFSDSPFRSLSLQGKSEPCVCLSAVCR